LRDVQVDHQVIQRSGSRLIRVIAICVFSDNGRILIAEGIDTVKQVRFARPLGGAVEPGETSRQAVEREIREELGQKAIELRLLGVLENIFEYQGKPGHEVVFVYDGRLEDPSLYNLPELPMNEPGWSSPAQWRSLDSFGDDCRLVPEGLDTLLA
jgi:ADP-ribose pyrophosphatase YjhB (NUDIX family)